MDKPETLYCPIPPTRLRNREEKFRKAYNQAFWVWVADNVFFRMLENRFFSLMIKNKEAVQRRDKRFSTVFYAPHCNWWDGIVGFNLVRRVFSPLRLRMMIEEMNRFPLFSKVGAFPVNKKSAQAAMKSLKYSVEVLEEPDIALWLFPEGIIKPPNHRPFEFQTGIAYMTQNCVKNYGGINLIPVSVNYTFLREDRPEVVVEIGEPKIITEITADRKELTLALQDDFEKFCNNQLEQIHEGDLRGYEYLFKQKLKWYKKLEKRLKRIDISQTGHSS